MISNLLSVLVFAFALFLSLIQLQNFLEISKTGRDAQPQITHAMTWICTLLWSAFFAMQLK